MSSPHNSEYNLSVDLGIPSFRDWFEGFRSVKEFGAKGDNATDDTDAIQEALAAAAAGNRRLYFPAGTYLLSETLELETNTFSMLGAGRGSTIFTYSGSGPGINITGEAVWLQDFKIQCFSPVANETTHGIVFANASTDTGYGNLVNNVHIQGFRGPAYGDPGYEPLDGCGLRCENIEHSVFRSVWAFGCGTGFYASNDSVIGDPTMHGISNRWTECRAQNCEGDGWHMLWQACSEWMNCQGFKCGMSFDGIPPQAMFYMGTGSLNNLIRGLDVENWEQGSIHPEFSQIGTGIDITGAGHDISFNSINLGVPFKGTALTKSVIRPSNIPSSTNPGPCEFDANSNDNTVEHFTDSWTDSGARNDFPNGTKYATKTADYTMTTRDRVIAANATGANVAITLPTASKMKPGIPLTVKRIGTDGNTVTVVGTVDGAANPTLASQYKFITVVSNGTSYDKIGSN